MWEGAIFMNLCNSKMPGQKKTKLKYTLVILYIDSHTSKINFYPSLTFKLILVQIILFISYMQFIRPERIEIEAVYCSLSISDIRHE